MKLKYSIAPIFIFSLFCLVFCSCSQNTNDDAILSSTETSSTEKGSRDNTPEVLVGHADGSCTMGNDAVIIDLSNSADGYLMVEYTGDSNKVKFQLTGPDSVTYTYDLTPGIYQTFPLTASDGSYTLGVYENIQGTSYSTLFSDTADIQITNTFGPYLYASQYVNFNSSSLAVEKGMELAASADSDLDVIESVYDYIITNFSYDYEKAKQVKSGYLPDIDTVLSTRSGICFDYASVMAAMLRTQRIPTRLEVGYVDDVYHAWISTYVEGQGWINGIIEFDGDKWNLMDPTFASASTSPKDFLTTKADYYTKYIY